MTLISDIWPWKSISDIIVVIPTGGYNFIEIGSKMNHTVNKTQVDKLTWKYRPPDFQPNPKIASFRTTSIAQVPSEAEMSVEYDRKTLVGIESEELKL